MALLTILKENSGGINKMNQAQGWRDAIAAMRNAHIRKSSESIDKVVKSLGEDVPVFNMSVKSGEERVPLNIYLATVKPVTEVEQFFTGAPLFDIWTHLPLGLTSYYGQLGVSHDDAQRLLERFNAYTWNEHNPELRKKYMGALRNTLWIADDREFNGWRAYTDIKPELAGRISSFLDDPELSQLNGAYALKSRINNVSNIEGEVNQIPPERFLDIFTPKGWKRMSKREEMIKDLKSKLKQEAQKVIEPLTNLGGEYRRSHIAQFYPSLA